MSIAKKTAELADRVFIKRVYEGYVFQRRTTILSRHLARLIPTDARVLDIGCGDGQITAAIARYRRDIVIKVWIS